MNAKEFLDKKINNLVNSHPDLKQIIAKLARLKRNCRLFGTFALLGLILGIVILIASTNHIIPGVEYGSQAIIILFIIGVLGVVAGLILLIFWYTARKKVRVEHFDEKITNILYDDQQIQKIYSEFYYKFVDDKDTDDFEIKIVKRIPDITSEYADYRSFVKKRILAINNNTQNSFNFLYKNKKVTFFIKTPRKFIEVYYTTDSKGNTVRHERIHYVSNAAVHMENTKYDETYNGVRVVQEKDPVKGLFQTDSIEFNKRFYINVKENDIRGPKFLSPRLIEKLSSLDIKNIYSVGIEGNIYADWFLVSQSNFKHDVCSFSTVDVKNLPTFIKSVIDKIASDFYLFEHLFDCVRAVY
ncbi:hypothetical protein [Spiroplasma tabanidicola]|uniref:DUF3137 domain-containing protein n=1 Tax=Spiroplasma tabanidicola TaxID=324079 RepID=A0A6I6CI07_9MOLU|nr:hypothetical protein [Spiroplasma tabanidicola]QGS51683.1 hypothetical protein STABA_v1c03200 [Spiroplasma tabanidicola]